MEVTRPEQLRDYWPRFKQKSIALVVSMQLVGVGVILAALMITNVLDASQSAFWILLVAMLAGMIGINLVVFWLLTEPLKSLAAALTHSAGEQSSLTLPNPNASRYQQSGLSALLKHIYTLGSERSADAKTTIEQQVIPENLTVLANVFEQSSVGVAICQADGTVLYANQSAPTVTDEKGNRQLDVLFYTDQSFEDWLHACEQSSVHAHKTWSHVANKPPGTEARRIFDVVASYQKGSEFPVTILFMDKTDDYAPEDDQLNFISFAAHELRGPITVIRGYLDTLVDEMGSAITPEQRELFDRLIVSSNRLSGYINNILNTSRYDQRHLQIHLSEVHLSAVWALIADDMQLRARSQGRLLSVEIPDDLAMIGADMTSLSEVLGNLVDNAIKYSNEGGAVHVAANQHEASIEIAISDNGIGMPANVVSNLFHKFYRSHRSRETVAGTGIGLYISKAIIESHGGTLAVRSAEGEGSTFIISLPTYDSIKDTLAKSDGGNSAIIKHGTAGWIKNHGSIRG